MLVALLVIPWTPPARASAYDAHPSLVVILVVDQFRADYLDRYRADFKGRGFRLFLDNGAYFEDCYYDYANTKTAPGHATLGTGAYTDGHGISSNAWWDFTRNKTRPVSSVEDDRYQILGRHPRRQGAGASPLNLRASTVGDSLRLATAGPGQGIRHLAQGSRRHPSRRLLRQRRLLDRARFRGLHHLQLLHGRASRLGDRLQLRGPCRTGRAGSRRPRHQEVL